MGGSQQVRHQQPRQRPHPSQPDPQRANIHPHHRNQRKRQHHQLDQPRLCPRNAGYSGFLPKKLHEFRAANRTIVLTFSDSPYVANKYYYGNTALLNEVRYFPLIQLFVVALFIFITIVSITTRNQSTQNQVWAGMAKETAHQLGTPISSLQGWVEMLKENTANDYITPELQKDVDRLKLVSDRFGKIGSKPQLEVVNLVALVGQMIGYIRKRATGKVQFNLDSQGEAEVNVKVSPLLFDWVIENLLKNALDAMEGRRRDQHQHSGKPNRKC